MSDNTTLTIFRRALEQGTLTKMAADNFDAWRNNPKKCFGDVKAMANELWSRYLNRATVASTVKAGGLPMTARNHHGGGANQGRGQGPAREVGGNPEILGEPFHNPYTFLPFPDQAPTRRIPTPLTADETDPDRFTGILDLEIELLSPLLTCEPGDPAESKKRTKREQSALRVGPDVVVPASGVRGALRSMMTALTGGTLGHLDEELWLCQGRDAQLGPDEAGTNEKLPCRAHLARVVTPGGTNKPGVIEMGETVLVNYRDLAEAACSWKGLQPPDEVAEPGPRVHNRRSPEFNDYDKKAKAYRKYLANDLGQYLECYRPHVEDKKVVVPRLFADLLVQQGKAVAVHGLCEELKDTHTWQIKLSQKPVNFGERRPKDEGALNLSKDYRQIELPADKWVAYAGRHRHADRAELQAGDLVWVETAPQTERVSEPKDVLSLQWSRWGREGEQLLKIVSPSFLPDSMNPDGKVDEVTDLFGQVPRPDLAKVAFEQWDERKGGGPAGPFAARIRFANLVFPGGNLNMSPGVQLAPLSAPHPGCAGFYRDPGGSLDDVALDVSNKGTPLRGYKVYRTTREIGEEAPHHYKMQGIYKDAHNLKPFEDQDIAKSVELVESSNRPVGKIRLALRSMSTREVMLLLSACSVDWRLGGGKPLGLGHCRVKKATLREFMDTGGLGAPLAMVRTGDGILALPEKYAAILEQDSRLKSRMELWQASQVRVAKLRYPRAWKGTGRGGHVWFQAHATPKKPFGIGLQVFGPKQDAIRGQPLPRLDPTNPHADVLYGYDMEIPSK